MHRSSSNVRRLAWCLAWCAWAWSARAAAEPAPSELVAKGLELRRERRDAEALVLFQQAFSVAPESMILGQIALAEQALGRWPSAEKDLSSVLATHGSWVDANRGALEKALAVIALHLSTLSVTSNVESAELWLDDQHLGNVSSAPVRVAAGAHELSLHARDGRSVSRSVALVAGEREHFHLEFPSAAPPVLVPPAALARAPEPAPTAPDRAHSKKIPVNEPAAPSHTIGTRQALGYASAALAVIALGEAITASFVRLDYAHRYNSDACLPERSKQCAPYRDMANTWGDVAVVGYAVAGAAGLSSLALFSAPYWYPSPSGGQAGLAISGRF